MENVKEFAIALTRILVGLIILVGSLLVLDIFVFLTATGSTFSREVAGAFSKGYDQAYSRTYDSSYEEAYKTAFDKGYDKGYELGLGQSIEGGIAERVELRNPTYQEMKDFLTADDTSEKPYITGEYVCYDFTADLNNNAEAAGLRASYVRVRSTNWAHALVAFETTDRGVIYIEPQSDKEVKLELGKPYPWWQVGAASPSAAYQSAISQIQIIW